MKSMMSAAWMIVLALGLLAPLAATTGLAAPDDARYVSVTIHGKLTDPETGSPMVGAIVSFVATEEEGRKETGTTDAEGNFEVSGLTYGDYAVEIETAEGEHIRGINAFPVTGDKPVEVILKISNRLKSSTSLQNQPERFMALVTRDQGVSNWKRFWRELAGFFGSAAALGLAAL